MQAKRLVVLAGGVALGLALAACGSSGGRSVGGDAVAGDTSDNSTTADTADDTSSSQGDTGGVSCTDGVMNGDETGVDCGGSCSACASCTDGVMNGSETGVDCGGECPDACTGCDDGVQNGTETGVDCGGECPAACPQLYQVAGGQVVAYPDLASLASQAGATVVGSYGELAGDRDVFSYEGSVYRVSESGELWKYGSIEMLVSGSGESLGTNAKLLDFQDFLVSLNASGQTWIYAIKPVGNDGICGIHSFESISAMLADDFSYHGSTDYPCSNYTEFFITSVGDRGAGNFYAVENTGGILHFEPAGSPTNKSWSDDFNYGSPVHVGTNSDAVSQSNVGIFVH